ncbi:MAG: transglutaminase-like domain-containing protein [Patescibacteria group bacterium]
MIYSPKDLKIKYEADLKSSEPNSVRAWMAIPQNSSKQKVKNLLVSPEPEMEYKDEKGNKILYFNFKDQDSIKIEMEIGMTLWKERVDFKIEDFRIPDRSSRIFKSYTKSEKFIEQNRKIKDLTERIVGEGNDIYSRIRSIFDFTVENFQYCYPVKKRGVNNLNLDDLKGDCGEYSSLFVAMCRSLGIPAINLTGFVIFPKERSVIEHGWASVYLEPKGWMDFDTQYASLEKNRDRYFAQRDEYRIVFTDGFNVPLKPSIPEGFDINYWNDIGLPMTRSLVQTFQPLVFAAKSEVEFQDNIRLI